ncbi:MAG TPA: hypothetical protein VI564_08485 [Candidatus Nanoarchaeia archaeon]|nr:hypothetical protein [Candidatus Nanoarchaeia archaeon]
MKQKNITAKIYIFTILMLAIPSFSLADEFGCCINAGAGLRTCNTDRLVSRDSECCPQPQINFTSYYHSTQNPQGPFNYEECSLSFFFSATSCLNVDKCSAGCCCSDTGGVLSSEAACSGSGMTFKKGEVDCSTACVIPQCNDGLDNDNNGCADFQNGDLGCTSPADSTETGGTCGTSSQQCSNPNYEPKLSNLEIIPAKGEKKFTLRWGDECKEKATSYEIQRCKGLDCSNFALLSLSTTNSFEDSSQELEFDVFYTYRIVAHYSPQISQPSIKKSATLGSSLCYQRTGIFCANNTPYVCDSLNKPVQRGQKCSENQVCIASGNQASCLNKIDCNYNSANPFGLFYTVSGCEGARYCFYDRSHTTIDSCFSCDTSMECYDYKSEETCSRDNCRVGSCKWKPQTNLLGTGACVSTLKSNCEFCKKPGTELMKNTGSFNYVFDICTKEKADLLSEGNFKCYAKDGDGQSCDDVLCTDYPENECSGAQITHDENNNLLNPSQDACSIKACQKINGQCAKNFDGDSEADCSDQICEQDYFAPVTTIFPSLKNGIPDSLLIQIKDKKTLSDPQSLVSSSDYKTFICLEPCGSSGHPFDTYTKSQSIIISGLSAFDSANGSRILTLKDGTNIIRYYSQDQSKNIGLVKKITIEAHSDTASPRIRNISVTDGSEVLGKLYTKNLRPQINLKFYEPATITFARIVDTKSSAVFSLSFPSTPLTEFNLMPIENMANSEYKLELSAKSSNNVLMSPPLSKGLVIDNTAPIITITPSGSTLNLSTVPIKITSNEPVTLDIVNVNSEPINLNFSTTDNKVFSANLKMLDGPKTLSYEINDYAKNKAAGAVQFTVDAMPTDIKLTNPKFGVAPSYTFDLEVETDNNGVCRYSLDDDLDFDFMTQFEVTNGIKHSSSAFNQIPVGDTSEHTLIVKCQDSRGLSRQNFKLKVDNTPPIIKNSFAFPNPVIEKPATTSLSVETDEASICKYSPTSQAYTSMENNFAGYGNFTFKISNRQDVTVESEGTYSMYVACENKAGLVSVTSTITFKFDLSVPLQIISHTPLYFNTTQAVIAIETNKKTQCKLSETDPEVVSGDIFGPPGFSHTKQIISSQGPHKVYIRCKDQYLQQFSSVKIIDFTVDTTSPIMASVNDTSSFAGFPEKTCLNNTLRVKFIGIDEDSKIKQYVFSLIKKLDNQAVKQMLKAFDTDTWVKVDNLSLEEGQDYYFRAKAVNSAGLESEEKESDGITVDTEACKSKFCGDNLINSPGEQCDGTKFGPINQCTQYSNFIGGTLKCTTCQLDTSGCNKLPDCGNKILDPGESCDTNTFGSVTTCLGFNNTFSGGNLKCTSTCQLDTTSCTEKQKCGNGIIDPGESCDGNNLGPLSGKCTDYNPTTFSGGNLVCDGCSLDTLDCQGVTGTCGDSAINIGEQCDGTIFGQIKNCNQYGTFSGGTLKCSSSCQLDTSSCTQVAKCGNGIIDPGESCDGTAFGLPNTKCSDFSPDFGSGTLACNSCKLDTSSCKSASRCGNFRLDFGEICDGNEFDNISDLRCTAYSSQFFNGTIKCNECQISTGECNALVGEITCKQRGDCAVGQDCDDDTECASQFCSNKKCAGATCTDSIKNQGESDIDCGGPCSGCPNLKSCNENSDCESSSCSFGICLLDTCTDGKLTTDESDIDCGGPCPLKCSEGQGCSRDEDCSSGMGCKDLLCQYSVDPGNEEPANTDTDGDGMPDDWEFKAGLDPNNPADANEDSDGDGLTNLEEFELANTYGQSTDPNNSDTDGDSYSDKVEVDKSSNPTDPEDVPKGTSFWKIFGLVMFILVLVGGAGFMAYRIISKKEEEQFAFSNKTLPKPSFPPQAAQRAQPQMQRPALKPAQAINQEQIRARDSLKKKQESMSKQQSKLFGSFGGEQSKNDLAKQPAQTKPQSDKTNTAAKKSEDLKTKKDIQNGVSKNTEAAKNPQKTERAKTKKAQTQKNSPSGKNEDGQKSARFNQSLYKKLKDIAEEKEDKIQKAKSQKGQKEK